jgi:hypothetical protein
MNPRLLYLLHQNEIADHPLPSLTLHLQPMPGHRLLPLQETSAGNQQQKLTVLCQFDLTRPVRGMRMN